MPLSRHVARALLEAVLSSDTQLEAFCGDYFPGARKGFTNGMDRIAKVTWLFDHEGHPRVVDILREAYPDRISRLETTLTKHDDREEPPPATRRQPLLPPKAPCFGRGSLTCRLSDLLARDTPVPICILGPPGIGKSMLTRAVIHSEKIEKYYGPRRYFVRLDAATSAGAAVGSILRELGITPYGDLLQDLCGMLGQERSLLVLDNLETPWDDEPRETEDLLSTLTAVPQLALMVSMRGKKSPKGVAWEDRIHVGPLDEAAATDLFCKIAGEEHRSDPALGSLLVPLAGVPLAITLLASTAEGNDLENVRCEWHAQGMAMLPEWVASLELSIASKRVTSEARRLGALVAALPDGIVQRDLEALMPGVGPHAAHMLAGVGLASFESGRLRMLAPVREYIAQNYPPRAEDLEQAMKYYGELGRAWGPAAGEKRGAAAAARLAPEMANIDAMIRRGLETGKDVALWIDTALALTDFAQFSGRTARLPLDRALEAARLAGETLREADCIQNLGLIALDCRRYDEAKTHFENALSIYRELGGGGVMEEANCIRSLGNLAMYRARYDEARACFDEALTLYRGIGDRLGEANCTKGLGNIALDAFRYSEAQTWFEAALVLYREAGEVLGEANCTKGLGDIALDRFKHDEARACFERARELYGHVGSTLGEANCIQGLGDIALSSVNYEEARFCFEESLQLYTRMAEPYCIGSAQRRLGRLTTDPIERRQHVEAARTEWIKIGRGDLVAELDTEFGLPNPHPRPAVRQDLRSPDGPS